MGDIMSKKIGETISIILVSVFIILTIFDGDAGRQGALKGLLICGNIIIPSVFSFTFLSIFLSKTSLINYLSKFDKITCFLFNLSGYEFFIFFISLIGGYPCGIQLLNNAVADKKITEAELKKIEEAGIDKSLITNI